MNLVSRNKTEHEHETQEYPAAVLVQKFHNRMTLSLTLCLPPSLLQSNRATQPFPKICRKKRRRPKQFLVRPVGHLVGHQFRQRSAAATTTSPGPAGTNYPATRTGRHSTAGQPAAKCAQYAGHHHATDVDRFAGNRRFVVYVARRWPPAGTAAGEHQHAKHCGVSAQNESARQPCGGRRRRQTGQAESPENRAVDRRCRSDRRWCTGPTGRQWQCLGDRCSGKSSRDDQRD